MRSAPCLYVSGPVIVVEGWLISDVADFKFLPIICVEDGVTVALSETKFMDSSEVEAVDSSAGVTVLTIFAHVATHGLFCACLVVQAILEIVCSSFVPGSASVVPVGPRYDVRSAEVGVTPRIVALEGLIAVAARLAKAFHASLIDFWHLLFWFSAGVLG